MRIARTAALFLSVFVAACASGGGAAGGETEAVSSDRNVITAAELANYATLTGYEVVQRIRRPWLQNRGGTTVKVFVGGNERGGASTLREYQADMIAEMRFVEPNEAMRQFGPDYGAGIIQVTLRR
jgi:hypothetical protein